MCDLLINRVSSLSLQLHEPHERNRVTCTSDDDLRLDPKRDSSLWLEFLSLSESTGQVGAHVTVGRPLFSFFSEPKHLSETNSRTGCSTS